MPRSSNPQPPCLDARLAAAANYVRPGRAAADIGCDHGKLSAWLAGSGRCPRVFACDLRPGPLGKGEKTCAPWVQDPAYNLILVPATKHSLLRLGLARRGFALAGETLCQAAGRWYTVVNARYTGEQHTPDAWFCLAGLTEGQPGFAGYLAQQRPKVEKYRRGLAPGPEADAVDRLLARLRAIG